ncbi:MAG: HlyD family efflux transporter periplasmic adaptor subunit [Siphonobacter sp.]
MDRDLTTQEIKRSNRRIYLIIGAVVVGLLFLFQGIRYVFSSTISQSEIRTAVAEIGNVANTLNASGEVLPELEQVLTSPISAVIQNVYVTEGMALQPGQKILELNKDEARLSYEKQKDQLELKRTAIAKLRLELGKSYFDLQLNDSIKRLRINSLGASVEDTRRLHKAGGATREDIQQTELSLKIAQLEKRQLENDIRVKQQTMQTELRESELQASIQQKDLTSLETKLRQSDITAARPGVVTWINKALGTTVREGEALARIADLRGFRVSGTIADSYADQLKMGMEVLIRINENTLHGILTNIQPTIKNGVVTFDIQLKESSSKLLRPNLKVELFLVTSAANHVVRVTNGAAFKNTGVQDVFVLTNTETVERRSVEVGASNFDYVEIRKGIQPGDRVILTDLSDYKHLNTLKIKE